MAHRSQPDQPLHAIVAGRITNRAIKGIMKKAVSVKLLDAALEVVGEIPGDAKFSATEKRRLVKRRLIQVRTKLLQNPALRKEYERREKILLAQQDQERLQAERLEEKEGRGMEDR